MPEKLRITIELSDLEHRLVINALKVWRGDFGPNVGSEIWSKELSALLTRLGYGEIGWPRIAEGRESK